jgi:hypothetical protein
MRETVKLTLAQKALVRGVVGLAERAAREAMRRWGPIQPWEVLVRSAHYGIALAAESFDQSAGPTFEQWAFQKALWTILDDSRTDRRQADPIAAARCAAMEYLRFEHRAPRDDDAYRTQEEDRAELNGYKAGLVAAILKGIAGTPTAAGGEDDMVARIDATRSAATLQRAYEGLGPEQLELMACECEADYQALAAKRGGKSWWTLQRAHAKLQKLVGARILGQSPGEMPAWNDEVWSAFVRADKGASAGPGKTGKTSKPGAP